MKKITHASALMLISAVSTYAANTFTSDLTSASSDLEISDQVGTLNAVSYTASGAAFNNSGGNDSRNYIRTVDTDYNTGSYMAEVTWNGLGSGFIGFGGGNVGTYGTPDWDIADSLWAELAGTSDVGGVQGTNPGRFDSNIAEFNNPVVGGSALTPVRFRMVYLSGDNTLQFFADNDYNGTFTADAQTIALDLTALGGPSFFTDPSDEARFFFGGGSFGADAPTFTDFAVSTIPEPSSYALLSGCLALGYIMVRRRRV